MDGKGIVTQNASEKMIAFLLPPPSPYPIGGNKVVYEYANRLSRRGYRVTVCHALHWAPPNILRGMYSWLKMMWWKGGRLKKRIGWFKLDSSVNVICVKNSISSTLPNASVWVATALETAPLIAEKIRHDGGLGCYFIQGLENWNSTNEQVYASWRLSLVKVVISRWLGDLVESIGESCHNIPNGIDFEEFWQETNIQQRDPISIGMGWHEMELKGTKTGIEAVSMLRNKYPDLKLKLFGTKRPKLLPWEGVEFCENPTRDELKKLYNSCAIFVAPSFSEGWGLTPCEAMACGCCVVATDIGGHREFCVSEETALLVPPRDSKALAVALARVLEDQKLRCSLAERGHQNIQNFTWERSVTLFDDLLRKNLQNKEFVKMDLQH